MTATPPNGTTDPPLKPFVRGSELSLHETGREAAEAGRRLGWRVHQAPPSFEVLGDWLVTDDFNISRLSFGHTSMSSGWKHTSENRVRVTYVVEGSGSIQIGNRPPASFGSGSMLLVDTSKPMTLHVDDSMQGIYLGTTWSRLLGFQANDPSNTTLFPADGVYSRIFAQLVTTTLDVGVDPRDRGFAALRSALEQSVESCVAARTGKAILLPDSRKRELYDAAKLAMQRAFLDPAVTPAMIALQLGVSEKYLQRVFRDAGATPARHLRHLRTAYARMILARHVDGVGLPLTVVAEMSGFSSVAALRRALSAGT